MQLPDKIEEYGEAMSALSPLQRNFVNNWCEHPNWSGLALVKASGYQGNDNVHGVTAHRLTHDKKVLAAMDEEAGKRMRYGGAIAVGAIVAIALNPAHKDHLKACQLLLDRTGRHATTEHKVIVDDKRPETKAELIAAIKKVATEAGLDEVATQKLIGSQGTEVIEAEFEEIPNVEDL